MLTITHSRQYGPAGAHAVTIAIVATSTFADLGPEIFVYHAGAHLEETSGVVGDLFECVASLQQMTELPVNAAVLEGPNAVPFFRKASAEFACRSEEEAAETYQAILEDIQQLVANYKASKTLVTTGTVTFE